MILSMKGITKIFPGVTALNKVDFDLKAGEVHGLVGENGAGKSTLMKVLGGVYMPNEGTIELNGKPANIMNPRDALNNKISIIYQEFNLVEELTVWENVFLGKEMVKGVGKGLDSATMKKKSKEILQDLCMSNINVNTMVRNLSVAQKQLVEIGKALFNETSILVMDEPTAALTHNETEVLFDLIERLKSEGISIIYISHRLEELVEIGDRVTILRDGEFIKTLDNKNRDIDKDEMIRLMVGRSLKDYFPDRKEHTSGETVLQVKNLTKKGQFEDISFELKKGEILGFAGLIGAGRTEIMKAIFGDTDYDSGDIAIDGQIKKIKSTRDAIKEGIVLVPEDRAREGLVLLMTVADNISLPNLDLVSTLGTVKRRKKNKMVRDYINKLSIRPQLPNRQIKSFSGGNQQKVVISKWLTRNPKIIILDEPTRGVDVGAKSEIYTLIQELSESGASIIFISSELIEVLGMCDRILAIHNGKITGEFSREEATQERIMKAATGT
ncbi:MAG: sugar ABC transporter ATP-binding protein [Clostridiales bacterium]|nr:sugar ABC transporter ATP-binding protein [Clostridiales bacterium]